MGISASRAEGEPNGSPLRFTLSRPSKDLISFLLLVFLVHYIRIDKLRHLEYRAESTVIIVYNRQPLTSLQDKIDT